MLFTMGRAEILRGRWEQATPWLDRAVEMNPNYAWAYYHRSLSDARVSIGGDPRRAPPAALNPRASRE